MRARILIVAGLASVAASLAAPALAQDQTDLCPKAESADPELARASADKVTEAQIAPIEAEFSSTSLFQISAEQGKSEVAIRGGKDFTPRYFCKQGRGTVVTGAWTVTVSTPLNKSGDETSLGNLDGLSGGTKLAIGFRELRVTGRAQPDTTSDKGLYKTCDTARANYAADTARAGYNAKLAAEQACSAWLVSQWDPTLLPQFNEALWGRNPVSIGWGVTATVAHQEFDYLETATLAKRSDEKTGWSVKASFAVQPVTWPALFVVAYERQNDWKAQKETILCPGGGGPVTCVKGAGGPPADDDKDIVSAEYRQRFGGFAMSMKVSQDFNNDVTGIDLPIYLVPNKDKALIGGLRLGWRSDTDDVTASVFVGTPFSFGMP